MKKGSKKDRKPSRSEQISREMRGHAVETVVEMMEEDGLEWNRGWSDCFAPRNGVTGRKYRGGNVLFLALVAHERGYHDPRWVTPNQARKLCSDAAKRGETWSFKGEKCAHVEYWKRFKVYKRDADGEAVRDKDGNKVVDHVAWKLASCFPVLNMAQIDGAPAYDPKIVERDAAEYEIADRLVETSECPISEIETETESYYSPGLDEVHLPTRRAFDSPAEFTSTLAHEMTHSTGSPKRLNRDIGHPQWTPAYAFEELVAELGSTMVCAQLGLEYGPCDRVMENHAAYLKSWLDVLKSENGEKTLFQAMRLADKAADLIVSDYEAGRGEEPETAEAGGVREAA